MASTKGHKIKVEIVQNDPNCRKFMEEVGYIHLEDEKSLRSDDILLFQDWKNTLKILSSNATTTGGANELPHEA